MTQERGFTIVELLLAMTFFSFVMLLVVTGFVQINRSYTRGLTIKEVQNSAREVVEEISRTIRDAEASDVVLQSTIPGNLRMCVGTTRYGWNMHDGTAGISFTSETYGDNTAFLTLTRTSEAGACNNSINQAAGVGETTTLLPDTLMVQHLGIARIGVTNSFRVTLVISTDGRADPTSFSVAGVNAACTIGTGDQFCDVARIDTVVTSRN